MKEITYTTTTTKQITDAEYDLVRHTLSTSKVAAIKFIRHQHSLGLKEAKDICDAIWNMGAYL